MFSILGTRRFGELTRITAGKRVFGLVPIPVHCYRIGSTLIDAGPPNRATELLGLLDGVEHVLLTHHHEDHVGAAAALAERGARIHAPEASLPLLADPPDKRGYQDRTWGIAEPVTAEPLGPTIETPDGRFEVIAVPGHTEDHVAFFEPERGWLFAGDAYLAPRETLRADEGLDGFLDSLHRMGKLDAETILPGHGSVVDAPGQAIGEVLDHVGRLASRARELAAQGKDPVQVRRALLGFEGFLYYYTRGHFSKQNLVDQLLADL